MVFTEQVAVTGDDEPKKEPVVLRVTCISLVHQWIQTYQPLVIFSLLLGACICPASPYSEIVMR